MKQNLLKDTFIVGMTVCLLGSVTACTSLNDDDTVLMEDEKLIVTPAVPETGVCTAENQGNCIVRYEEPDLNLNQTYAGYAMSTNSSYQLGSVPVSSSAPAGMSGLSVKDKIAQREFAQQQADLALQPVQGGQVLCTGETCSEALFKTEIEKTIQTTLTETQKAQTGYIYVASDGQSVTGPVDGLITPEMTSRSNETTEKNKGPVTLKEKIAFGEEVHDWEAPAGDSLRNLLMRWGEMSGWTVVWKLDRDYNLEAGVVFRGKFTEVAAAFIRSYARATPAPIGTFYKGNRVLVINTQENENAE